MPILLSIITYTLHETDMVIRFLIENNTFVTFYTGQKSPIELWTNIRIYGYERIYGSCEKRKEKADRDRKTRVG